MRIGFLALLLSPVALFAGDATFDRLAGNLDNVTVSISIAPFASQPTDPGGGLRSVLLYTDGARVEPARQWPDGTPASGSARISKELMLRVVETLDRHRLLASAETYYSERAAKPKGKPPASKPFETKFAKRAAAKSAEFEVVFFDDDYYTYYVIPIPWGEPLASLLTELRTITDGSRAPQVLAGLLKSYERFR
jgi:hypothetical protein